MATRGGKKVVAIEVEGRTEGAVAAVEKLANSTKKARAATEELSGSMGRSGDAADKAATKQEKQATAMGKAGTAAGALGTAINSAKGGTLDIAKAATSAASSFGPYGIAVAVVGNALLDYVDNSNKAAEAARAFWKEIREQVKALHENTTKTAAAAYWEKDFAESVKKATSEYRDKIDATEKLIAKNRGLGESNTALEKTLSSLRVEALMAEAAVNNWYETEAQATERREKIYAQVRTLERSQELADAEAEGAQELADAPTLIVVPDLGKKRGAKKPRDIDQNIGRKIDPYNADAVDRNMADQRSQMNLQSARRNEADAIDPFSKENVLQEAEQKLAHDKEVREASLELAKEERHKRELKRIEEETEAREAAAARQEAVGSMIGNVAGNIAQAYITSGDRSAKAFKKMVAGAAEAEAIRMTVLAVSEGVQALVSLASLNFPGAAAHGAAAGAAAAGAVVIGGIAASLGGFGSGAGSKKVKGFEGSAFGPAANESAANERPTTSNGQKDTAPVSPGTESDLQQSFRAQSGVGSNAKVINMPVHMQVLGAVDKQTAVKFVQGVRAAKQELGDF